MRCFVLFFGLFLFLGSDVCAQLRKAATKSTVPVKIDTSANSKMNLINRTPPATTTTTTTTTQTTTNTAPPPPTQSTTTPAPPPPPQAFQYGFLNRNFSVQRTSYPVPTADVYHYHATDYDADGIADISYSDGQMGDLLGLWLKRDANNNIIQSGVYVWSAFNAQTAPTGGRIAVATDLTGDGRTDFVYIHKGINWAITVPFIAADSKYNVPVWQYAMINYVSWPSRVTINYKAFAGDFNGDGKGEVAVWFFDTGSWEVALSNGSTLIPANGQSGAEWITQFGMGNVQPFTGDFNGDRYTDIGMRDNQTGSITVALNNRNNGFVVTPGCASGFWINNWQTDPATIIRTGDFNGDRRSDLLAFNPTQRSWQYILSNGAGCFTNPSTPFLNFGAVNSYPLAADVNGDGKADIVAGTVLGDAYGSQKIEVAFNISR